MIVLPTETKKQANNRKQKKVMKTKNNVQKAVMKSLAVIMSLVLLSITVQAQDFWASILSNNSFHQIAMALTSETETPLAAAEANTNAKVYLSNFEEESESPMDVEPWMTSDKVFNGIALWFVTEREARLELDEWMTDQDLFDVKTMPVTEIEAEAQLELEEWMTDDKAWEI